MPKALSVYLDLLRFSAALVVFIVHANYDRFTNGLPVLWRLGGLGNDAVMVFFVLSGFVIAYVSASRENTPPVYFAARLARLWSVCLPALALTITLDTVGAKLSPTMYDGSWFEGSNPFPRTVANLLFVNEIWFWSIRPFSNGPYWSIGYEFWYYLIFGTMLFLRGKERAICITGLLLFVGPKILLLLPVWFAGVWAFRTRLSDAMSTNAAVCLFIATVIGYMTLRLSGAAEILDELSRELVGKKFSAESLKWSQYFLSSYCIGGLIALNFAAARTVFSGRSKFRFPSERSITYLAGFTFSLYLFHYPLLQFFAALTDLAGIVTHKRYVVVVSTLMAVWIIGSWAERQKAPLKRHLLNLHARLSKTKRTSP